MLPELLASIRAGDDDVPPEVWTETRAVRTLSDLTVLVLGPPAGSPTAVLKLARSPKAAAELRAHAQVVADLRQDGRLEGWTAVLPTILFSDFELTPPVLVERYIGGVDLGTLLRTDRPAASRSLAAALAVVRELHDRTAQLRVSDDDLVDRWLGEPLATVAALYRSESWQASALRRLGDQLRAELVECPVEVGWTHGDYTPGNLRVSSDGREVLGIVDWGGGCSGGLAALDTYLLLMTGRAQRERRELGKVVAELVNLGEWPPEERRLLGDLRTSLPHRTLVLLCWLRHIASNLNKASFYHRHTVWRTVNVDAVLHKISPCKPTGTVTGPIGERQQ